MPDSGLYNGGALPEVSGTAGEILFGAMLDVRCLKRLVEAVGG